LIIQAAKEWNIDLSISYMIGDRTSDIQAGEAACLKQSVLIPTNVNNALLNTMTTILK
jgi:histidinol phosphatase-like enzyme